MAERTYWEEQLELVRKQYQDVHEKWFKLMSSNMTEEADPLKDEESILFDEIMEIRQNIAAVRSQEMSESSLYEEQLVAVRKQYQEVPIRLHFDFNEIRNEEQKRLKDKEDQLLTEMDFIRQLIAAARVREMSDSSSLEEQLVAVRQQKKEIDKCIKATGYKEIWDLPKKFGKEVFQKELIRNEEIKQNNCQLWDEACILSFQKEIIQKNIAEARVKKMEEKDQKAKL